MRDNGGAASVGGLDRARMPRDHVARDHLGCCRLAHGHVSIALPGNLPQGPGYTWPRAAPRSPAAGPFFVGIVRLEFRWCRHRYVRARDARSPPLARPFSAP